MRITPLLVSVLLTSLLLTPLNSFAESEKVVVDKKEFEQLKEGYKQLEAAVKLLMEERQANNQKIEQAQQAAEEASEVAEAAAEAAESPILEGLANVSIGGYGEVHYNNYQADDDDAAPFSGEDNFDEFDIHRFVLFFGYQFTDNLRFYSEFEIEHGGVESDGDRITWAEGYMSLIESCNGIVVRGIKPTTT